MNNSLKTNKYLTHIYINDKKYIPSNIFKIEDEIFLFFNIMDIGVDVELTLIYMDGENFGQKKYILFEDFIKLNPVQLTLTK